MLKAVHRVAALFCYMAAICHVVRGEIDEEILKKDLYEILGIGKEASQGEIKKTFRKLAQIYHPDKSKPEDKELHEKKFQELSEAYDILSDENSRHEYDSLKTAYAAQRDRGSGARRGSRQGSGPGYPGYTSGGYDGRGQYDFYEMHGFPGAFPGNMHEEYYDTYHGGRDYEYMDPFASMAGFNPEEIFQQMEEMMQAQWEEEQRQRAFLPYPELSGPRVPAGRPFFPYSPIMVSPVDSDNVGSGYMYEAPSEGYFVYLDMQCSLGVYHADTNELMDHLVSNIESVNTIIKDRMNNRQKLSSEDFTYSIPTYIDVLYRTPPAPELHGNCFAGLDEEGTLNVFQGKPDSAHYEPVWSSAELPAGSPMERQLRRFFLELSTHGDLSVRQVRVGSSGLDDSTCMWSTTSCNEIIAGVQRAGNKLRIFASPLRQAVHEKLHSTKTLSAMTSAFSKVFGSSAILLNSSVKLLRKIVSIILSTLASLTGSNIDDLQRDGKSTVRRFARQMRNSLHKSWEQLIEKMSMIWGGESEGFGHTSSSYDDWKRARAHEKEFDFNFRV